MVRRRGRAVTCGTVAMLVGAVGVVAGASSPWLRTGAVTRSSFALARSARNLGLVDSGARRAAVALLFLAPMLLGAVVLLVSLARNRLAAMFAAVVGAVGALAGAVGTTLPGPVQRGPMITLVSAVVALGGSVVVLIAARTRTTRIDGRSTSHARYRRTP